MMVKEGGGVYLRILKIRCTRYSCAVDGIEKMRGRCRLQVGGKKDR